MKFLRSVLFVILILNCRQAALFSQELNLVLEPGIGSYAMKDLKSFNNTILSLVIFDAKITDDFPDYWNNKLLLQYTAKRYLSFGITCSYQSTGARISRVDYSGEYQFDTRIRAFSPGVVAEFYLPFNKLRFSFSNEAGIEFTKLRLSEYLKIKSVSEEEGNSFTSKNWYYEPTVKLSYPVKFLRLGIATGYLMDLKKGTFQNPDLNNSNIKLSNGKAITSDWSGLRIRLSLSVNLLQFKSTDLPADPTN